MATFVPQQILDEIRARLPVSQVVSRRVKLKRQGREFIGLSPFKNEKTPSFTVNDQKGFYHCFASGEHGDIFTFLMQTEGLSFPEAVERLAAETGVVLPKSSPEAAKRAEKNDILRDLMAASAQFFRKQLNEPQGQTAKAYLSQRGLTGDQIERFQIGYAPRDRGSLKQYLLDSGFPIEDMILSGMLIGGKDIAVPYDRFRHRIMFPILDLRGRVIAFGGRALDADQPAKYLNSPETPLFHKGHQLYNTKQARQPAYDQGTIVVVEGYMDVIALDGAGFKNAVAPLGTALTPDQMQLLWRMASEPVLCLDGDEAGTKAAYRAIETSLSLLKPGYSLRFAFLPEGQDPDDLIKSEGTNAIKHIIEGARPLSEVLWQKEFRSGDWSTPERRAALEQRLLGLVGEIQDATVRAHYSREIKSRLWRAFQSKANKKGPRHHFQSRGLGAAKPRGQGERNVPFQDKIPASNPLLQSPLVASKPIKGGMREALLIVTLLNHPWLLEDYSDEIASFEFDSQKATKLRDALLEAQIVQNSLDSEAIESHLEKLDLSSIANQMRRMITHNGHKYAEADADPLIVHEGWQHLMMRHQRVQELKRELIAAEQAFLKEDTQENFERIKSLKETLEKSQGEVM